MENDPKQQADVKMATNMGRQKAVDPRAQAADDSKGAEKGSEVGGGIKEGLDDIKNVGENLRKNINDFADNAKERTAKQQ